MLSENLTKAKLQMITIIITVRQHVKIDNFKNRTDSRTTSIVLDLFNQILLKNLYKCLYNRIY